MPPFTEQSLNPFHEVTGAKATQLFGLDYEENFNYKYDNLLWNGTTPEDFHLQSSMFCTEKRYAGIIFKDKSMKTKNNIRLVKTEDDSTIATIPHLFATLGIGVDHLSKLMQDFDLTDHLKESSYEVETNRVHLEVDSFDENGDSIPPITYKPTFDYFESSEKRTIKIHVDYFEDYAPEIESSALELYVEFFNSDGRPSNQVKRRVIKENGDIKERPLANAPVRIKGNDRTEFIYKTHIIAVKLDPQIFLNSMPGTQQQTNTNGAWRLGEKEEDWTGGEDCLPTARDPCQSAGCVKVVPWNIKYLEDHGNTVKSNLTVMVAWCGELKEDIYELQTEDDFNNCENFPEDPVTNPSSHNGVDGFIVTGPDHKYYASNKCQEGGKVKIEFI